jgi:hypothetical protein
MSYKLSITPAEKDSLEWLAARGYFPEEILRNMMVPHDWPDDAEGFPAPDAAGEILWEIPEFAAWSLPELEREDPDAYLACMGEPLLSKVLRLADSIV